MPTSKLSPWPTEITSDAAGYSDLIFGLFYMIGYQFSPRLANAGETRFWHMHPRGDYGPLDGLSRSNAIKTSLGVQSQGVVV